MGFGRQLGYGIRWFEKRLFIESAGIAFGVLLYLGFFKKWNWTVLSVTLSLVLLLISRLVKLNQRFSDQAIHKPGGKSEYFQLELLLLCSCFLLIQLTGSHNSPLYPVLYILLAATGGFDASVFNRIVLVLFACCFELLTFLGIQTDSIWVLATHLAAIVGFPFMVGALEWTWTTTERKKREAQIVDRLRRAEQEADEYRLSGMTSVDTRMSLDKRREDLKRSSVKQIGISMVNVLDVLDAALRPHCVAVYWLSMDETTVTLKASRPRKVGELLITEPMEARSGLVGAILKSKEPVRRNNLRKSDRGLTYYYDKVPIKTFVGVPLLEGEQGHLRGVLLADRRVDVPFGEEDEQLLQVAAGEILRTMDTEMRLNLMDQLRNEAKGLYDSTEGLIKSVSLQEVSDQIAHSLCEIFNGADFAAVVLQENEKSLIIKAVEAQDEYSSWKNDNLAKEISRNKNLCSLAMRRGLILPDQPFDKRNRSQQIIFGAKNDPPGLRSLKVAPLKLANSRNNHQYCSLKHSECRALRVAGRTRHNGLSDRAVQPQAILRNARRGDRQSQPL
ncbi:MAG: GAF domain-containing protein [Deltaproteobacteria bacterium]|nr:GAF domain-containing protein [Deltaproteobacteria bacterium]